MYFGHSKEASFNGWGSPKKYGRKSIVVGDGGPPKLHRSPIWKHPHLWGIQALHQKSIKSPGSSRPKKITIHKIHGLWIFSIAYKCYTWYKGISVYKHIFIYVYIHTVFSLSIGKHFSPNIFYWLNKRVNHGMPLSAQKMDRRLIDCWIAVSPLTPPPHRAKTWMRARNGDSFAHGFWRTHHNLVEKKIGGVTGVTGYPPSSNYQLAPYKRPTRKFLFQPSISWMIRTFWVGISPY